MRPLRGMSLIVALAFACAARGAWGAGGATLEVRGTSLTHRQAEALLAPALRAPRDSSALAQSLGRLIESLQEQGYLDARAAASWDTARVQSPALRMSIVEGARYRLQSLALEAGSPEDSARFATALRVAPGGWAAPAALGRAVERAVREAADHGHPYAQLGVTGFEWDSAGARVRLTGALGPTVTISRVRYDGLVVTNRTVVRRAVGPLEGTPYDRAAAEAARDRLAQLGLFSRVTFEGVEGEGDWSKGQLVYRVEEPHYNRFEGVVGVQGQSRAVGVLQLDLDNLGGSGRGTGLRWESRGQGVALFGARYAEPMLLGLPLRGEVAIEQLVQDTLFTRTRWGGRFQYALSGQERLEAGYDLQRVVQATGEVEEADLQSTTFALERDTRDQPVAPRRGARVRIGASQSFKSETLRPDGSRSARASAVEGGLDWNRPLSSRTGLAWSLSGAARFSSERVLPLFERYPVGGATSLRGQDEEAFRVDRYALSRLEWRLFLGEGNQRVALFWDHAFMATRLAVITGGDRLDLRNADGVGFGLRLDAPGGVVGVDYGLEPGRPPLEGKIHLQLVTTF